MIVIWKVVTPLRDSYEIVMVVSSVREGRSGISIANRATEELTGSDLEHQ